MATSMCTKEYEPLYNCTSVHGTDIGIRIKVVQQRDRTTVGVKMNVMVDQQTDHVAETKATVAEVPTEGEGTVPIAEQIQTMGLVSIQSIKQSSAACAISY